jgi:hypothetical protein
VRRLRVLGPAGAGVVLDGARGRFEAVEVERAGAVGALLEALNLIAAGAWTARIGRSFPLDEAADAHRLVATATPTAKSSSFPDSADRPFNHDNNQLENPKCLQSSSMVYLIPTGFGTPSVPIFNAKIL